MLVASVLIISTIGLMFFLTLANVLRQAGQRKDSNVAVVFSLVFALILLVSIKAATAGEPKWGIKAGGSLNAPSIYTNKLLSVNYENRLSDIFGYRFETGIFAINEDVRTNLFAGPQIGINSYLTREMYIKVYTGPAYVHYIDQHTSTHYQFNSDIELGLVDNRGVGVGIGYKHISNAGLCNRCSNLGRDFLFIKVNLP